MQAASPQGLGLCLLEYLAILPKVYLRGPILTFDEINWLTGCMLNYIKGGLLKWSQDSLEVNEIPSHSLLILASDPPPLPWSSAHGFLEQLRGLHNVWRLAIDSVGADVWEFCGWVAVVSNCLTLTWIVVCLKVRIYHNSTQWIVDKWTILL